MRRAIHAWVLLLVTASGTRASAQTQPSIDARTWAPSTDPRASLVLEPARVPDAWVWNVGAWASYAQAPVVLRDASTGAVASRPLAHSLGLDVVAGLALGARLAVGVDVPFFLWQDGTTGLPPTIASPGDVKRTGLGDVTLSAKVTLIDNEPSGMGRAASGFGLAAIGIASLPTGDRTSFWGDGAVGVGLRALAEYAVANAGAARASLGYTLRTSDQAWPDTSIGGVTFGDAIPWAAAVVLMPRALTRALDSGDRQLWEVGLHGTLPAGPVGPFGLAGRGASSLSPALLALDDRVALGHYADWSLLFGAELGLDRAVGVPTFRAVVSLGWATWSHDRDHDGIVDEADRCPDLPEDKDGVEDSDGCPEDDADGDGVIDAEDACPTTPGKSDFAGCPHPRTLAPAPPPTDRLR